MNTKIKDLLKMDDSIDVYDDYDESVAICFVGPIYLTEAGQQKFKDILDVPVEINTMDNSAILCFDDIDFNDSEIEEKVKLAAVLFRGAAGYTSVENYNLWFKEKDEIDLEEIDFNQLKEEKYIDYIRDYINLLNDKAALKYFKEEMIQLLGYDEANHIEEIAKKLIDSRLNNKENRTVKDAIKENSHLKIELRTPFGKAFLIPKNIEQILSGHREDIEIRGEEIDAKLVLNMGVTDERIQEDDWGFKSLIIEAVQTVKEDQKEYLNNQVVNMKDKEENNFIIALSGQESSISFHSHDLKNMANAVGIEDISPNAKYAIIEVETYDSEGNKYIYSGWEFDTKPNYDTLARCAQKDYMEYYEGVYEHSLEVKDLVINKIFNSYIVVDVNKLKDFKSNTSIPLIKKEDLKDNNLDNEVKLCSAKDRPSSR